MQVFIIGLSIFFFSVLHSTNVGASQKTSKTASQKTSKTASQKTSKTAIPLSASLQQCNLIKDEYKYRTCIYKGMDKKKAKKEIRTLNHQIKTELNLKIPGYKKQIKILQEDIAHIKKMYNLK